MIKSFFNHDAKARLASVVKRAVSYGVCARFCAGSRYLVVALCVFGCLPCMLSSCVGMKSTNRRLSDKRQKLTAEYSAELEQVTSSTHGGEFEATWNEAMEKMYLQNPSLIQADYPHYGCQAATKAGMA